MPEGTVLRRRADTYYSNDGCTHPVALGQSTIRMASPVEDQKSQDSHVDRQPEADRVHEDGDTGVELGVEHPGVVEEPRVTHGNLEDTVGVDDINLTGLKMKYASIRVASHVATTVNNTLKGLFLEISEIRPPADLELCFSREA